MNKRSLDMVKAGKLGDIVSVDIKCGATLPLHEGGQLPPWYRDPGFPMRDLGVHCLSLIQELLGTIEDVEADYSSLGGDPNLAYDEWLVRVRCQRGVAKFQLTYSATPVPSQITIHGTKSMLRVPWGEPPPVPDEVAAAVAEWVEKVASAATADHAADLARFTRSETIKYLVTGASGSLGKAVVNRLRADGHPVRVFVRRLPEKPQDGIEYAFGNLGDPVAVDAAIQGAEIVIHCGAAMKGGWPEHKVGTVVGTQNVVDSCITHGVKQLVHISSMSVFDWAGSSDAAPVDETVKLEPRAEERGAYTRAKLEAEELVSRAAMAGLPVVILRPGQIFGRGIPLINGAVARSVAGRWLVLGDGKLELPLVYIDDVVDAVMLSIDRKLTSGEIIHLIDPAGLTQDDVLSLAGGGRSILRVPRALVFALGRLSELPLRAIGKASPIGVYRLKSALARIRYESNCARKVLGWTPRVGVREGILRVLTVEAPPQASSEAPPIRATGAVAG